eukprot:Gb_23473 [translate_table: standard]
MKKLHPSYLPLKGPIQIGNQFLNEEMISGSRVPSNWENVNANAEMKASEDLGIVETIYEEYEENNVISSASSEELENVVMVMNMAYSAEEATQKGKRHVGSASSSVGSALQRNIWAWCEATGLPTSVTVHVKNCSFKLHKYPLVSKSGYMKRNLSETMEITLTTEIETFELIANFCYGSTILMDPFNVVALRCAAEVLEMTEEYGKGNLCQRSDVYLTQVVLQSWEDTLVVLQKCQVLLPLAEEIQIVSRCIESMAFIACMEVLDPQERRLRPAQCQFWSDISASLRQTTGKEWWFKDILALSLELFERIVISMRKQGMEEMIVSRLIVQYATKWVLSEKTQYISRDITVSKETNGSLNDSLECIIGLLSMERCHVPLNFLFSLLHQALGCDLNSEYKTQLEARIASQLELATIDDFLFPVKNSNNAIGFNSIVFGPEVRSMQQIVSMFMCQQSVMINDSELQSASSNSCGFQTVAAVANLWDEYLTRIAYDARLNPSEFSELVATVPCSARCTHDLLYKAIHTYLVAHPQLSQEERLSVCKFLNCQKLSQEACIHAVRNELMPLRLIVQAMFMQQLHTRQSIWANSNSLQLHGNDNHDSIPFLHNTSMDSSYFLSEDIRSRANEGEDGLPLGFVLKRDAAVHQAACLKADYEATSFRLRNLEEELIAMKKNLEENKESSEKTRHIFPSGKSESFRVISVSKPVDTGCRKGLGNTFTSTTNWFSQRKNYGKFAQKLLKGFHKLGFRKSKNDQVKDSQETSPCSPFEDSMAEVEGQAQSKVFHRRSSSFS